MDSFYIEQGNNFLLPSNFISFKGGRKVIDTLLKQEMDGFLFFRGIGRLPKLKKKYL